MGRKGEREGGEGRGKRGSLGECEEERERKNEVACMEVEWRSLCIYFLVPGVDWGGLSRVFPACVCEKLFDASN